MNEFQKIKTTEFWQSFSNNITSFQQITSPEDTPYEQALGNLQEIDEGLWIEYCLDPGGNELVITAEGKENLFPLVEEIVKLAPEINGWTFTALKPKLGFPVSTQYEGVTIEIGSIVFDPLFSDNDQGLGLRIYVPGIKNDQIINATNGLLTALDHGLGERYFSEQIQHIEVCCLDDTIDPDEFIPLTDLEKYINWRLEKLKTGQSS
ncbi:MAG: hypothetical protein ACRBBN_11490 [Methyloligellaceae bacterium]